MRRRALLKAGGLGLATGFTGCVSTLPFGDDAGVDAAWSTDRGNVVDVESYHAWIYTQSSAGSPVIAAHDPTDGSVEWTCDACRDAIVAGAIDRWERRWEAYLAYPKWVGSDTLLATVVFGHTYELETVALDPADGTTRWHADQELVGVADDLVYLHRDGTLTARRIGDGGIHHELDLTTIVEMDGHPITQYESVGDTLYVTAGPRLFAIDPRSGTVTWRFVADGDLQVADVHTDYVYASSGTTFYALPR